VHPAPPNQITVRDKPFDLTSLGVMIGPLVN